MIRLLSLAVSLLACAPGQAQSTVDEVHLRGTVQDANRRVSAGNVGLPVTWILVPTVRVISFARHHIEAIGGPTSVQPIEEPPNVPNNRISGHGSVPFLSNKLGL